MTNSELEIFLTTDDTFVLDCVVDQTPKIKDLQLQRDELKNEVELSAKFNYAREPEFVRDRAHLRELRDEVAELVRKTRGPLQFRMNKIQTEWKSQANKLESSAESLAKELLEGELELEKFTDQYIRTRKETIMKQTLADKFKEFIGT